MRRVVVRFVMFWYDFVVGDDASVAIGVVLALALTAWLAHAHWAAWWIVPAATAVLLVVSLARAARVKSAETVVPEPEDPLS